MLVDIWLLIALSNQTYVRVWWWNGGEIMVAYKKSVSKTGIGGGVGGVVGERSCYYFLYVLVPLRWVAVACGSHSLAGILITLNSKPWTT